MRGVTDVGTPVGTSHVRSSPSRPSDASRRGTRRHAATATTSAPWPAEAPLPVRPSTASFGSACRTPWWI